MNKHFEFLKVTRENCLKAVDGFSGEQLNKIPEGFNNNLIWNLGHLVATQQLLCYALSGLETKIETEFINRYRKGTKPESVVNTEEIQFIKEKLLEMIDIAQADYEAGIFKEYKTYTTSFNATLTSVEDAIIFNNIHEGMHLGNILSMKKLV